MNSEYAELMDFLNNGSELEHELAVRLQLSDSADFPDRVSTSEFREDHVIPHLFWDDVLQMMQSVYRPCPEQERFTLFLRSSRHELAEHTRDYFEMIYVLSGNCVHRINGNTETLRAGDLCILSPSARHMQFQDPSSVTAKLIIQPSYFTDICPGLLQKADYLGDFFINSIYTQNHKQYVLFHTDLDPSVRVKILEIGRESLRDDLYSDRIVSGLLMSLLTIVTRDYSMDLHSAPVNNNCHEILSILKREYDTITLESLAKRLHYSVPYCSKYIKKLFGINFSSLLYQIRFQIAEQYLRCSGLTVIQISKKLGYENPENFIRAFRNYSDLTPAQYRKKFLPPP